MGSFKLGVEVVGAHDLIAKDGQGSSNPFVELHFDDQRFRTTVKENDLNPVWNESFYFNISDPNNLIRLHLEAYVYSHNKANNSKACLGKVRLTGTSFVPYSDAVVLHYPLEKRTIFSRANGELGLKVFLTDDPSIKPSNPLPAMESFLDIPISLPEEKTDKRHTFHSLPNANNSQQKQNSPPVPPQQQQMNYGVHEMKSEPQAAKVVHMVSGSSSQPSDYALKETSPVLGGGRIVGGRVVRGDKPTRPSMHDLVEQMRFLFVRVVKARDLPAKDMTGSLDPYVEVKIGNYKGKTKHYVMDKSPEWNQVFAFSRETQQSSVLEVILKDKDLVKDDFVGVVQFDLHEVPERVPTDSPLAPEWYRLKDKKGEKKKGELMLAVWYGTQADEAFPEALHSDAFAPGDSTSINSSYIRSKVYHSPRLWYVRVNVIEAQDLVPSDKNRFPDVSVKAQIGNQTWKTKSVQTRNSNPIWNQEFMFVASEPFEDHLIFSVEDRVKPNKDETMGMVVVPLSSVGRRADDRPIRPQWYSLEKSLPDAMDKDRAKKDKFHSRLHVSACLDGGYHVLDESTQYSSDLRPTAKQLWKSASGALELGILNANGLQPMKTREGRGTSDTYCVAKYGHKWVRTRTIVNSLNPKYNEQYTWEVHDTATVLTVGVFDNSQIGESNGNQDMKIGKVRIRISTLETGRVYTHSYPLLILQPSGVKKMGELHLAIRFSSTSMLNMMLQYSRPLLPKMHYKKPLTVMQQDMLRYQAVNIVAARLGRAEPPLKREVIEYMSDTNAHLWSMRRSKANFLRLTSVFTGLLAFGNWFGEVCKWKNSVTTVLVHVLFVMLVCFPELILPTVFLYMFMIGAWRYRFRPRYPPHMNTSLSCADAASPDELDEEFETFPATKSANLVRMRYDRLRSVAGKIQSVVGDIASQGERLQALLSWRDPRATTIFMIFCLAAAIVMYVTPFQVFGLLAGFYFMRHPKFRHKTPAAPINFFRRLPAMTDSML
ncbi:putative Kiwellin [Hibiscus syriacus]|uniref:Kiwellin n=1 Tax=Hibiscus syriacus TaxID=106335 RepID=A0A6A3A1S9_HIBSY|nr:FT-interacting protein 3-like [Hibiscus syriacus]KAE8697577.1 putative Kiwellin [Hibiscus syriacus]